ncbi:MAG: hypothetical protein IJA27_07345 [Lachnospiraceae bacterium]|nr:hypothetical protein [Lachnospiraceae bacterium]
MESAEINKMRDDMLSAGIYSKEDIEEICRLESEYLDECESIAEECVKEGYPSHGENYDLRCSNARKYYDEEISLIDMKYESEESEESDIKNYKDFEKQYIGNSDISSLILVGCGEDGLQLKELAFGQDGFYDAYMVEGENVEIGKHYKEVAEFKNWLKVYDDEGLILNLTAKQIKIYRAGEFGCIIQRINSENTRLKELKQQINPQTMNITGRHSR